MKFREGIDYTVDSDGNVVMTADFLLARGYCCESGCRNCPYGFREKSKIKTSKNNLKAKASETPDYE